MYVYSEFSNSYFRTSDNEMITSESPGIQDMLDWQAINGMPSVIYYPPVEQEAYTAFLINNVRNNSNELLSVTDGYLIRWAVEKRRIPQWVKDERALIYANEIPLILAIDPEYEFDDNSDESLVPFVYHFTASSTSNSFILDRLIGQGTVHMVFVNSQPYDSPEFDNVTGEVSVAVESGDKVIVIY